MRRSGPKFAFEPCTMALLKNAASPGSRAKSTAVERSSSASIYCSRGGRLSALNASLCGTRGPEPVAREAVDLGLREAFRHRALPRVGAKNDTDVIFILCQSVPMQEEHRFDAPDTAPIAAESGNGFVAVLRQAAASPGRAKS